MSTAIVFFKRMCIRRRLVDINPWLLCATVLYLASKVEESFTKVQEIVMAIQPKAAGPCGRQLGAPVLPSVEVPRMKAPSSLHPSLLSFVDGFMQLPPSLRFCAPGRAPHRAL